MNDVLEHIIKSFNEKIKIREKRPGIFQLFLPIYHEDGDMIDIFLEKLNDNSYKLCDYGMTIMRLSYSYEIDSENKEAILQKIISENSLKEENGNIFLISKLENIYTNILHVCQSYMKIGSMRYFKREVIESLFYEMLDEYIITGLKEYSPQKHIFPISSREDLEPDYEFKPNGIPIYLFGVKDSSTARLAIINCLEYQKAKLKFRSLIVHENFDKLSQKDRARLTNACDKQFTSFFEFKENAKEYFEREKNI